MPAGLSRATRSRRHRDRKRHHRQRLRRPGPRPAPSTDGGTGEDRRREDRTEPPQSRTRPGHGARRCGAHPVRRRMAAADDGGGPHDPRRHECRRGRGHRMAAAGIRSRICRARSVRPRADPTLPRAGRTCREPAWRTPHRTHCAAGSRPIALPLRPSPAATRLPRGRSGFSADSSAPSPPMPPRLRGDGRGLYRGGNRAAAGPSFRVVRVSRPVRNEGRFSDLLRGVPTFVVTAEYPAFTGLKALTEVSDQA